MLADLLRKGKRWHRNWVFVSPQAYAGPVDTPPMPMGGLAETKEGGGCFIATAAFGSPFQRHVRVLRKFRDRYLLPSMIGKQFVKVYYHYSPPVADIIAEHYSLKAVVRVALLPVVFIGWLSLKFGFIFILITTFLFTYGTIYMIRKKYYHC